MEPPVDIAVADLPKAPHKSLLWPLWPISVCHSCTSEAAMGGSLSLDVYFSGFVFGHRPKTDAAALGFFLSGVDLFCRTQ